MTAPVDVLAIEPGPNRSSRPAAWWGMAVLIATEATVFAILVATYLFLRAAAPAWPPAGVESPDLTLALPFSFVLWGSSIPLLAAERSLRRDRPGAAKSGLLLSALMGLAFLAATFKDFSDLTYGWRDSAYASAFYTLVGLHTAHVAIGVVMNVVVQLKVWLGRVTPERHLTLTVFAMYWHFVDAVWLVVFPVAYLSPHFW